MSDESGFIAKQAAIFSLRSQDFLDRDLFASVEGTKVRKSFQVEKVPLFEPVPFLGFANGFLGQVNVGFVSQFDCD